MKKMTTFFAALTVLCFTNANAATYFSKGSLAANELTSWSTTADGLGASPTDFISPSDVFMIQSGHEMTTSADWIFGAASGNSKLQIADAGKLTGTTLITIAAGNTFQIDNGGTYINNIANDMSKLFGGTEVFASNSNFIVILCASAPTTVDGGYGNLTFRNTLTANLGMNGRLLKVKGNLKFELNTATFKLALVNSQTVTIDVDGDLIVNFGEGSTGAVQLVNSSTGNCTLNVKGNVNIMNGSLNLNAGGASATNNVVVLSIGGDLTINSTGSLSSPSIPAGPNTKLIFTGANSKLINNGTFSNGNFTTEVPQSASLTVPNKLTVSRAMTILGSLSLGDSILGSGLVDATAGTLIFKGVAPQNIAKIKDGMIKNLTLDNAAGAGLGLPLAVSGSLNLVSGSLTLGDNNLTIKTSGSIVGSESSIVVNGLGKLIKESTSVKNQTINNLKINISEGRIGVQGLSIGDKIYIYSIDGKSRFSTEASQSVLDILIGAKGIYVIRVISSDGVSSFAKVLVD
jgi:hypothetical protein